MVRFAVGYFLGIIVGFAMGAQILGLKAKHFQVNCAYNDGIKPIELFLSGFEESDEQLMIRETCRAYKAVRECKYLRALWPDAKAHMTDLFRTGINVNRGVRGNAYCGYSMPMGQPRSVFVASWNLPDGSCPSPAEIIFHEALHLSGLPGHKEDVPPNMDAIYQTQYACFRG